MTKAALCLLLLAVSVQLGSMQKQKEEPANETYAEELCAEYAYLGRIEILEAIANLTQLVQDIKERATIKPGIVEPPFSELDPAVTHPCGGTRGWRRVAYLDLNDTRYHCPAGWRLTGYPVRTCGRASSGGSTCDPVLFDTTGGAYTKVCGRVVGYQFGATAAFATAQFNRSITIDESYVTGVSITHGNPREHLWTYAVGHFEGTRYVTPQSEFCPCEHASNLFIPPYVGAYWYCESGDNYFRGSSGYNLFPDDPLWDGEGCRQPNLCCQHDGPLYFVRELPSPSTDPIEVRICNYRSSQYSDVLIANLELYVK